MRQPPGRAERRGARPRKPREERWPELIQVATQVFYEKGYDAASLQDIADWLGLLKGSLYYYIKSKDDLLYTVISEVHRAGLANIESLAAAEGSALQRLRGVIVEDGQREGLIRPAVDPKLAALSILGSTNWVYRWFQPDGEFTARQIGEQFADMIIRGLAAAQMASGR